MGRQRDEAVADDREDKTCGSCGRRIEWRSKWARDWEAVRWCSDACRARGVRPVDRELEASIRALLAARPADATICPSEAARVIGGAGEVEITQNGRVVDPSTAKGPIRIRRAR
jgi:hypothetical protein